MVPLIEIFVLGSFLLVMVTQVFIPAIMGRKLFPIFRKSAKIEAKIAEKKEEQYVHALEETLDNIDKQ